LEGRERRCFGRPGSLFLSRGLNYYFFSPTLPKQTPSRGTSVNLSHTSRFLLFVHLDFPRFCLAGNWTLLICVMIALCFNSCSLHHGVTLVVCERLNFCVCVCVCAYYPCMCARDRDEVNSHTHTHTHTYISLTHSVCLSFPPSPPAVIGADCISLLAAGRLPVTNWES